jgi:23S rRNA (pseudouridine1915-N3)-methyltransferase
MRTTVLAVGKLRPALRAACDEYPRRIRRYGPLPEHEVREAGRAGSAVLQRREEGIRLLRALPAGSVMVALDRWGTGWSSEDVAKQLERWRTGAMDPVLVIGGAVGLDPELLALARYRWSLGALTLPHELARVVVLEQWYRAWTILRGEPYHKGVSGER